MAKLEGYGIPTKFKTGERGDVYTDLKTGKRYKCLGKVGFFNSDAVEEPIEYHWQIVDMVEDNQLPDNVGGGGSDKVKVTIEVASIDYKDGGDARFTSDKTFNEVIAELNGRDISNIEVNIFDDGDLYKPICVGYMSDRISFDIIHTVNEINGTTVTRRLYIVSLVLYVDGDNYARVEKYV